MNTKIQEFWHKFCHEHNLDTNTPVDYFAFGYSDEEADHLADLVNRNIKTATTSIYNPTDTLPCVGEYSIILDSKNQPVCIIQEKVVEVIPYNLISQEHAYHEGEGDRSYSYWKKVHDEFFKKEFQNNFHKSFNENTLMVCEVFEKVN